MGHLDPKLLAPILKGHIRDLVHAGELILAHSLVDFGRVHGRCGITLTSDSRDKILVHVRSGLKRRSIDSRIKRIGHVHTSRVHTIQRIVASDLILMPEVIVDDALSAPLSPIDRDTRTILMIVLHVGRIIERAHISLGLEHYIFYVRLRDLYARDKLTDMLLKPETDMSSLDDATDVKYYHQNGTGVAINWAKRCTECIVDNYFRHENEVAGDYTLNGMYTAGVNMTNALDSAINATALEAAANVDQNLVSAVAGQGDATTAVYTSEIDKAMREYQFARMNKVTDMTFEDWCEQFGVKMPQEELFKPELIRYSEEWTYPSNTIDPTSGAARSAVSWAVQLKADKDRYFKEPGFLVGVCVVRPKVYFKNLDTSFAMLMKDGRRSLFQRY